MRPAPAESVPPLLAHGRGAKPSMECALPDDQLQFAGHPEKEVERDAPFPYRRPRGLRVNCRGGRGRPKWVTEGCRVGGNAASSLLKRTKTTNLNSPTKMPQKLKPKRPIRPPQEQRNRPGEEWRMKPRAR